MKKCICTLLALCLLTGFGTGRIEQPYTAQSETETTVHSAATAETTESETTRSQPETTAEARTQTAPLTGTTSSAAATADTPESTAVTAPTVSAVTTVSTVSTASAALTQPDSTSAQTDTTASSEAGTTTLQSTTEQTACTDAQGDTLLTVQQIGAMPAGTVLQGTLSAAAVDALFSAAPLSDAVLKRITGVSYRENPDIQPGDLRYLRMLHRNAEGQIQIGEMIVNARIADDVLEIFRALFDADYPIARMVLVDEYGADDNASMAANNTSAFNYRKIANTDTLSRHAHGLAIDVNPLYNPYITRRSDGSEQIAPAGADPYADRTADFPMKITADDLCCRLFLAHGFTWGGSWSNPKDYQHFEKP